MPAPQPAQPPVEPGVDKEVQAAIARGTGDGTDRGFDMQNMGPKAGESYNAWVARLEDLNTRSQDAGIWGGTIFAGGTKSNVNAYLDYVKANRAKFESRLAPDQNQIDEDTQKKKEADFQAWRMSTMQRLDAFSKEMGMPVEELIARGDLGVKNAGNTGRNQAGAAAYGAGLGDGGVSNLNTQRAVTDAQSKYQMGRQQMGLNATQGLLGEMGNMAHEQTDQTRYEQGMNMSLQQAQEQARQMQFAQKQQQNSQLWGTIGGVAGAMWGGPAGAAAGQALGSGLGGQMSGTYKPTYMQYPKGNSSAGSGGLGGGNRYGGSQ